MTLNSFLIMKHTAILLLGLLFTACSTSGQSFQHNTEPSTVSVNGTGVIKVPADLIQFHIQLTKYSESAREAFREHKQLEDFLTQKLIEEGISAENIQTEPVNIRPVNRGKQYGFETHQSVVLKLDDIGQFEEMQLVLIENDFTSFSGNFSSTEISRAEDEALAKAVEEARREARILAEATGGRLGKIQSIQYGGPVTPFPAARMEMSYDASGGSLLQFEQTIPVQKNVQVVFELLP